MFEIKTDTTKNRLFLNMSGFMSLEDTRSAADQTIAAAQQLRPGFTVVNDIAHFKPVSPEAAKEIERAQVFLKNAGVGRIIRIVGDSALAAMQFERTSKAAGYEVDAAANVADAEKLLDR